jgi:hypothetical protein
MADSHDELNERIKGARMFQEHQRSWPHLPLFKVIALAFNPSANYHDTAAKDVSPDMHLAALL